MRQRTTNIEIIPALLHQQAIVFQLYQLYTYEMTDLADFDIGDDGYYRYADLPLYWTSAQRFPYLVYVNKKLAGFVLVQRGSPIEDDLEVWDMAEFFIMKQFRKQGIGEFIAHFIFKQFIGRWQIRVWENNKIAHLFWDAVIRKFTTSPVLLERKEEAEYEGLLIYKF